MENGIEVKKLPIGIESFEEMRTENFYYIDKTMLIADLLRSWGKVNLFTRPRRFGKTLNMSMLKSFFEIGTDPELFDGLAITKEPKLCEEYMGKFPVVFLSLKDVDGLTYEKAEKKLSLNIMQEAQRLHILSDSPHLTASEQRNYQALADGDYSEITLESSLKILTGLLQSHYEKRLFS